MTAGRRALWIVAAVLAAVVLGVAAGEAMRWPMLRGPLERAASQAAKVPVTFRGDFKASLIVSPRLEIGHLTIGPGAGVLAPHLLDGRATVVGWRWWNLWRWHRGTDVLRLTTLRANFLDVQLLRHADGRATWQIGPRETPAHKDREPRMGLEELPRVGVLQVRDGRIRIDDKLFDTELEIQIAGQEGDAVGAADAGYRATISGRHEKLPVRLTVQAGGALPLLRDDTEGADEPVLPLRVEGVAGAARVMFDGKASALMGARKVDGAIRVAGASLARAGDALGLTLPQSPAFELEAHLVHDAGLWQLGQARLAVGRSDLGGDFRYDARRRPGQLTGTLTGKRLSLADLGPSIGARTGGTPARPSPSVAAERAKQGVRMLPQRSFDLPSLRGMNANLKVAIDEFDLDTAALAPLRGLRTALLLDRGVLQLRDLQATVAGGRFSGSMGLDANRDPARFETQLQFAGVDVAGFVRGARAPAGAASAPAPSQTAALRRERQQARAGGAQPVRSYITGVLDGDVKAQGSGRSTAEILGSLDGRMLFVVRDGTLSHLITEAVGLDIAQALGVLVRGDEPLPLRCARLELTIKDGVATAQRGVLDNRDSVIRVAGRVNLNDESLALVARARPKDFSPFALRVPITVTGTLSDPQVGIQGGALGAKVLGALALGAIAGPLAALLPLVDPGVKEPDDACGLRPPAPR